MSDLIDRQAAIDAVDSETVITNPEHFKSNEKFIKFMDDSDISSFGKWQWANGFNTALVATRIHLKKLPSAQPQRENQKTALSVQVKVDFDDMKVLLEDIGKLQTYKLFVGDDMVLVDVEDIKDILAKHVKAKEVQSQRNTGKWINHRKDDGHNIADCDQCGNAIQWFDGDEIPRYCCMCGADMRGESDV